MAVAFAGAGLSEWFHRRDLAVLSQPLTQTALLLPLLPAIGFGIAPMFEPKGPWHLVGRVFCLMSASLLKWIRSRFLIQYRGYVKTSPSPEQKRRRAWAYAKSSIIAGIVSALTIYALARWRSYGLGGWFLVILGALFCAANMYYRPLRFKVNGILALAAGLFLAFRRIPLNTGIPIFFTFVGCLSLISGLFVLLRFMREAKEAAQA